MDTSERTVRGAPAIEGAGARWLRRCVSFPLLVLVWGGWLALLPVTLPLAAAIDVLRRSRLARARLVLLFAVFFCTEVFALAAALWLWLRFLGRTRPHDLPARRAHANLQRGWVRFQWHTFARLFGISVSVEGQEALAQGPALLLSRHASTGDTLLPHLLSPDDASLRMVLKRELLWDPSIDVVGQRLVNAFVKRGGDTAGDLARVQALGHGLERDLIVVFPEGTRFSAQRKTRLVDKLTRAGDAEGLARLQQFTEVLPPRAGGVLELLDAAPGIDVVFCAHRGLE
ncbi:MAG: 1-acyl-sn-glycerol-3-phosphate acyltransferase, partial [Deltaproteobacteria bacterium]|nr:1-acyl-sn-glycerol-3-phosphate acyltransferase [Deltaproteobacteria bacterium]